MHTFLRSLVKRDEELVFLYYGKEQKGTVVSKKLLKQRSDLIKSMLGGDHQIEQLEVKFKSEKGQNGIFRYLCTGNQPTYYHLETMLHSLHNSIYLGLPNNIQEHLSTLIENAIDSSNICRAIEWSLQLENEILLQKLVKPIQFQYHMKFLGKTYPLTVSLKNNRKVFTSSSLGEIKFDGRSKKWKMMNENNVEVLFGDGENSEKKIPKKWSKSMRHGWFHTFHHPTIQESNIEEALTLAMEWKSKVIFEAVVNEAEKDAEPQTKSVIRVLKKAWRRIYES